MRKPLAANEKLSIKWDDSNDQPERFPGGYWIVVVLEWTGTDWVNVGRVYHVSTLLELDNIEARVGSL